MDLNRIQGGIDKVQEQLEKMNNEGGGQKQGTAEPQQTPPQQQQAVNEEPVAIEEPAGEQELDGEQADTRQAQPPQGEERRHEQASYDGEDRRKLQFSYA